MTTPATKGTVPLAGTTAAIKTYRIKDWSVFVKTDKRIKAVNWVAIPTHHDAEA